MTRPSFPLCATALCLVIASSAEARDYGQHGTLWPVIELDLLTQIHARLLHLEATGETTRLNEELKRRTIARVNRPTPVAGIALASTLRRWHFDPTITVDADIKDNKGRTIIARGTRVNPLDTVPLRAPLVFLNGENSHQVDWAMARFGRSPAKFILVAGAPLDLMKARQRRFYFDQGGTLTEHFAIRAVPAVVEQQGRRLLVTETPPRSERAPWP